ncbi:glycoside hydrolase family protein [Mycobacteroides abscessus subsp. abscessus]|nr:glycoside hydrolase family protein [Mycobacteroides abscessus subsp. abscessus]
MGAAAFIGRVGGLAAALGIGAALAGGVGIACAEGSDTSAHTTTAPDKAGAAQHGTAAKRPGKTGALTSSAVKGSAAAAQSGRGAGTGRRSDALSAAADAKAPTPTKTTAAHAGVSTAPAQAASVPTQISEVRTKPAVAVSATTPRTDSNTATSTNAALAAVATAALAGSTAPTTSAKSVTTAAATTTSPVASKPAAASNPFAAWLKQIQRMFFNSTPTATFSPSDNVVHTDGTITGTVHGYDADGDVLTYVAGKALNGGTVVLDANGNFTYTPGSTFELSARTDLFAVTVSDASPINGVHYHGFMGLFNHSYGDSVSGVVTVDASKTAAASNGWGAASKQTNFTGKSALSDWYIYDGAGNGGYGIRTPDALSFANNVMTITGDAAGTTGGLAWWPGQKYGMWEVRMKVPEGAANYNPVALLWPDSENWPVGGEVDFMETQNDPKRQSTSAALHYGTDNQWVTSSTTVDATQWHNYAVSWTPDRVTAYVDGVAFFSSTDTSKFPPSRMHLCLQLDVGGPDLAGGAQMQVAWARQHVATGA